MKPHEWRRSKAGAYLRHLPRLKHVKGTWLHRRFGDRIFDPELWQPNRDRVACGVAAGAFFSMMPIPFQMILSTVAAVVFRFNIPSAAALTWISNPITMPVFVVAQYELGRRILCTGGELPEMTKSGMVELVKSAPMPLLVGAGVSGLVLAVVGYVIALFAWDTVTRMLRQRAPRKSLKVGRSAAGKQ
ncbi:MAG: DUF2062 domain-containing protein [Terrimicrobiaceae bacterium]